MIQRSLPSALVLGVSAAILSLAARGGWTATPVSVLHTDYQGTAHSTRHTDLEDAPSAFHVVSQNGNTVYAKFTSGAFTMPVVGKLGAGNALPFAGDFSDSAAGTRFHLSGMAHLSATGEWIAGEAAVQGTYQGHRYVDSAIFCLQQGVLNPAGQTGGSSSTYSGQLHSTSIAANEDLDATLNITSNHNGAFTAVFTSNGEQLSGSGRISKSGQVVFYANELNVAQGTNVSLGLTGQVSATGKVLIGTTRRVGTVKKSRVDERSLVCLQLGAAL